MPMGFTTKQVCSLTNLSARQVDYFDKTALITPSMQVAAGKGSSRLYSYRDLIALRMVSSLRQSGLPLQTIRKAVDFLKRYQEKDLSETVLLVNGRDDVVQLLATDPESMTQQVMSLVKEPGQLMYLFINLGEISREVDQALHAVG